MPVAGDGAGEVVLKSLPDIRNGNRLGLSLPPASLPDERRRAVDLGVHVAAGGARNPFPPERIRRLGTALLAADPGLVRQDRHLQRCIAVGVAGGPPAGVGTFAQSLLQ